MTLHAPAIRFQVEPRDVLPVKAARRLGMTETEFEEKLERLHARGFPRPDPDTGRYDLKAIDAWMDQRSSLTILGAPTHASTRIGEKLNDWQPGRSAKRPK